MSLEMDLIVLRSDSSSTGDSEVAVVISRSLLCNESPVFKKMFNDKMNNRRVETGKARTDDNMNVASEADEKVQSTENKPDENNKKDQEQKKDEKDDTDDIASIVKVKCQKALSIKVLFDFIQGHDGMLKQCEDFYIFADMISLCDFYGMNQHVSQIEVEIKRTKITTNTMMNAMETVKKFESLEIFKSTAKEMESRCHEVFADMIKKTCDRIKEGHEVKKEVEQSTKKENHSEVEQTNKVVKQGFDFQLAQHTPQPAPEDRVEKEVMDVMRFVGDITSDVLLSRLIAGTQKIIIKSLPETNVFTFDAKRPILKAGRRTNQ